MKTNEFKSEFPVVFDNTLGFLLGGPANLTPENNPEPVVRPPRTVPESLKMKFLVSLIGTFLKNYVQG